VTPVRLEILNLQISSFRNLMGGKDRQNGIKALAMVRPSIRKCGDADCLLG